MKTIIMLFAAILAAGCTHNGGPEASARARAQAAEDEADLAAALSGRIAGPPQDCVNQGDLGGNKSYGRGVILFSGRTNDVVFVNRPAGSCPDLNFGRALKTLTTTTQLCRGDIVTVFDPISGTEYGGCGLGEFTPYRRAR
jgi:hypothetical protein